MTLKKDQAKKFEKLNVGLIPPGETIRGVLRAQPKGETWRRGKRASGRVIRPKPTPITYQGEAAAWPNRFARNESVPDSWSSGFDWFFWVVITDKL